MKGESNLVSLLRQRATVEAVALASNNASGFRLHPSSLRYGIGDDAAVIARPDGGCTVITTDLLVENIDFRRLWMPPRLLGHKALAVSLSDVAAMGATPRYGLVALGVPEEIWHSDWVEEFYEGWFALARTCGVALIGGDISRTPEHIAIDSIVWGETATGQPALMRHTAQVDDIIYLTGTLGGAARGLELLETGTRYAEHEAQTPAQQFIRRQLTPMPRLAWGAWLGAMRSGQQAADSEQQASECATALMDISDGLSTDLARLCAASNVGAIVEAEQIPVQSTLTHALNGGEDFELLFTGPPDLLTQAPAVLDGVSIKAIGKITTDKSIWLQHKDLSRTPLVPQGFTHF